jgi:hypothetical protein
MSEFSILGLIFALFANGPNDLLDYIPSDAYWQQKGVAVSVETMTQELKAAPPVQDISKLIEDLGSLDVNVRQETQSKIEAMGPGVLPQLEKAAQSTDAEVATRAKESIDKLKGSGKAGAVRRLMAIRALGESKDKKAIDALTPLLASKDMFEADYAAAAIGTIEGKPVVRSQPDAKTRAADINSLPEHLGVVAQGIQLRPAGKVPSVEEALKTLMPLERMGRGGMPQEQFVAGAIMVAERAGNLRVDSLTVGLSENVGDQSGYVMMIFHGQYDQEAARTSFFEFLHQEMQRRPPEYQPQALDIGGVPAVQQPGREQPTLLFLDTQHLAFIVGPGAPSVIPGIVADMKSGTGKIAQDEGMAKLLKEVDTTKPIWAVTRINDSFRQAPPLAAFDSIIATAEAKGADVEVNLTATGSDAAKVKAAVDSFNLLLAPLVPSLSKGVAQQTPKPPGIDQTLENAIASLKTIKITAAGAKATGTATVKEANQTIMLMPVSAYFIERGFYAGAVRAQPGMPPQ